MVETELEWCLRAEDRLDYDAKVRLDGKLLRCYRHGQVHGLRVIEGESVLLKNRKSAGRLIYGPWTLPLDLPHTHSKLWFRKVGYLVLENRPGHAVRLLRKRFFF